LAAVAPRTRSKARGDVTVALAAANQQMENSQQSLKSCGNGRKPQQMKARESKNPSEMPGAWHPLPQTVTPDQGLHRQSKPEPQNRHDRGR